MRNVLSNWVNRDVAVAFAAGAAMLLASLANFLSHNSYPYFRPEIGLIVAAVLAIAALMALWYVPQRQWGRSLLEGVLAALFVDLNTDSVPLMAAAGLAVIGLTAWRRMSLLGPMAVLGAVVLLTTVAGVGGRPSWISAVKGQDPGRGTPDKPVILHLILDEHLGLEGLAVEGVQGKAVSDELRSFYAKSGFAVYGGAYSQHYHSANAIPYILNYGKRFGQRVTRHSVQAGPTQHLQSIVNDGYRLTVLQSDYADVCTDIRYYECITYDSSSLRPTLAVPMSATHRVEVITSKFLRLSRMFGVASVGWKLVAILAAKVGVDLPVFDTNAAHSSSVGALEAIETLMERLRSAQPGDAFFAHLLIPHHPYVADRDCRYRQRPWQGLRTSGIIEVKRSAYYEQLRCTKLKVAAALDALSQSKAESNAIIVIHGDHGSRISPFDLYEFNRDKFTDADVIAGFSTIFAVRYPGSAPTYIQSPRPVASLLGEFARSNFTAAPAAAGPILPVQLDDRRLKITGTMPLPASWTNGLDRPAEGH